MNIFYLDEDPKTCAQYHCDTHCNKMILETAQLLSTAHRETGSPHAEFVYKSTHKNHPSAIWARSSHDHYSWLFELFRELLNEFAYRRGKQHASGRLLKWLCHNPPDLPTAGFTSPPQCMPDEYKCDNTVGAYRKYYVGDKAKFATWKWRRPSPNWYNSHVSTTS